jgi:CRP-like cAMP-binding protein
MSNLEKLAKLSGKGFTPGQNIFAQDDPGSEMYIVQSGGVDIIRQASGGEELLASLGPGEFFGEMALVDERPRSATARAAAEEGAVLVSVNRDFLFRYAEKDTGFVMMVLSALSARLESTDSLLLQKYASMELSPMTPDELAGHTEPKSAAFLKSFQGAADPAGFRKVERGGVIFRQEEPGAEMFIILDGQVRISQQDGGNMFALAELGRGDFFGEMALISGHSRTATATALSPAVLMPVSGENFKERARKEPQVALHLVQIMILRLRTALQALS